MICPNCSGREFCTPEYLGEDFYHCHGCDGNFTAEDLIAAESEEVS